MIEDDEEKMMRENNLEFREKKLNPFTYERRAAARAIGLSCFNADSISGSAKLAIIDDALLVMFLCSQPTHVSLRAKRVPDEIIAKFNQWMREEKISDTGDDAKQAIENFEFIMQQIERSSAKQVLPPEQNELSGKGSKKKSPAK